MEKNDEKVTTHNNEVVNNSVQERQKFLDFFKHEADDKAKKAAEKIVAFRTERIALTGGSSTSIHEQQEAYKKFIAENENNDGPFFCEWKTAFDKLINWPEEKTALYSRPKEMPDAINQTIYDMFGEGFLKYVDYKNKYVKYYIRRTKKYKLLNPEGLLKLVTFIKNSIKLMDASNGYYDYRKKHNEQYGSSYQLEMF